MNKRTCPICRGPKAYYAVKCLSCHKTQHRRPTCSVPGCASPHCARGFCDLHYSRMKRGLPLEGTGRAGRGESLRGKVPCSHPDGCPMMMHFPSTGLCSMHHDRLKRTGDIGPSEPSRRLPSPDWREDNDGYVYRHEKGRGKQMQHRWVMEQAVGRRLRTDENVHHLNGIRNDNRLENLELWSRSQPPGQRVDDKIAWAIEFLGHYGYTVSAPVQLRLSA